MGTTKYDVGVEDAGGEPVWSFDSPSSEVTFDPRVLEDTTGSLAVSVRDRASAPGTTVGILRRSPRIGYRSSAGKCRVGPARCRFRQQQQSNHDSASLTAVIEAHIDTSCVNST